MVNLGPRHRLTNLELPRGICMLEGMTQRHFADHLGSTRTLYAGRGTSSKATVTFLIVIGGCQRSTSQHDERFLHILARRHPFATATQLLSELMNATGVNVLTQTIRNRLHDTGLRARKFCICILLSRKHKQRQLIWEQDNVNWPKRDWKSILFKDKSRYCLDFTNHHVKV